MVLGVSQKSYRDILKFVLYTQSVFTVIKFIRIAAYILCEKMTEGRRGVVPNPFYYIFVFNTVLQTHNK